jgi:hypothetical protein
MLTATLHALIFSFALLTSPLVNAHGRPPRDTEVQQVAQVLVMHQAHLKEPPLNTPRRCVGACASSKRRRLLD